MTAEKEILIWAKALYALLEEKTPKDLPAGRQDGEAIAERLKEIFKEKRKTYLLPRIIKKLEIISLKARRAELFLAMGHSASMVKEIEEKLSEIIGKEKNIEVVVAKELIGGFRAKTGNLLVKASIKDFLDELKSAVNYT